MQARCRSEYSGSFEQPPSSVAASKYRLSIRITGPRLKTRHTPVSIRPTGTCSANAIRYGLLRRTGLDGLLDFIRQTVQASVQPVVHIALGLIRGEVPDQGSLSRFLAKFFD